MGTYTINYNLFLPSIGEQGWGDLVNGNFSTIDTTMKGLDTRLTTCESTDVAYNTRLETLEAGEFESANIDNLIADEATFNKIIVPPITNESSFCIYSKTFTPITGNYGGAMGVGSGTIIMFENKYLSRTLVTSDFFKVKGVEDDNIEDVTININASTYIVGYVVHDGATLLQAKNNNITQTFTLDISKPFTAKYYSTFNGAASSSLYISITAGTVKYYL